MSKTAIEQRIYDVVAEKGVAARGDHMIITNFIVMIEHIFGLPNMITLRAFHNIIQFSQLNTAICDLIGWSRATELDYIVKCPQCQLIDYH